MTILIPNSPVKLLPCDAATAFSNFQDSFNRVPLFKVIAPGRVNLIGEHTDYNLLPVLPMPLDRAITLWVAPRTDSMIRLVNANPQFTPAEFSLDHEIEPLPDHWTNYARAAVKAVLEALQTCGSDVHGFDAMVQSDLPAASGLSSSSALVIGTCLAFLKVNNQTWQAADIAERMRIAEQFVGTAGGGMDQAVLALGKPGSAVMVEFDPLAATPVCVPHDLRIFVINSGQKAEKSGAARFAYNRRALECALAVELIKQHVRNTLEAENWQSLRDVYNYCESAKVSWSSLLLETLPVEPVTAAHLIDLVGQGRLEEICHSKKLSLGNVAEWLHDGSFQIYPRAAHVLAEADRVYQFADAMASSNIAAVYHLARASHTSCRDLYNISTPLIEELIAQAEAAGAGAARITGAGFGGCIVAFVPVNRAGEFVTAMAGSGIMEDKIIEAQSTGAARVCSI